MQPTLTISTALVDFVYPVPLALQTVSTATLPNACAVNHPTSWTWVSAQNAQKIAQSVQLPLQPALPVILASISQAQAVSLVHRSVLSAQTQQLVSAVSKDTFSVDHPVSPATSAALVVWSQPLTACLAILAFTSAELPAFPAQEAVSLVPLPQTASPV